MMWDSPGTIHKQILYILIRHSIELFLSKLICMGYVFSEAVISDTMPPMFFGDTSPVYSVRRRLVIVFLICSQAYIYVVAIFDVIANFCLKI